VCDLPEVPVSALGIASAMRKSLAVKPLVGIDVIEVKRVGVG
jgi:hypothetical protein